MGQRRAYRADGRARRQVIDLRGSSTRRRRASASPAATPSRPWPPRPSWSLSPTVSDCRRPPPGSTTASRPCALLESTGLGTGERVLILGASGGMGTLLVQLAKAAGAEVAGVALVSGRRPWYGSWVRTWSWTRPGTTGSHRPARRWARPARDVVLDGVGGAPGLAAFALTADGGSSRRTGRRRAASPRWMRRRRSAVRSSCSASGTYSSRTRSTVRLAAKALAEAAVGPDRDQYRRHVPAELRASGGARGDRRRGRCGGRRC